MNEIDMHLKARQLCSLEYWYPKVANITKAPKTAIIPLPENYGNFLEEGLDSDFVAKVVAEAKQFGYPLFMRTDQMAAKHSWKHTCYVEKEELLGRQLFRLLEENEMANMFGEVSPHSICLREFLHLKTFFTCKIYGDMPVAREFRVFATNGEINCVHPYWAHLALEEGEPSIANWRWKLRQLEDMRYLDLGAVARISERFPEQWSIDFCQDIKGEYWLSDMALGSVSWHWKHGTKGGGSNQGAD